MTELGKVYKITCNDTGDVYYGSTTNKYLSNRKAGHIHSVKRYDEGYSKKTSAYNIIKNNNFKMELIEEPPLEKLKERERYYIENFKCVNQLRPNISPEERLEDKLQYYHNNKQLINEKRKEKRLNNSEKVKEKEKEKRLNNSEIIICECGSHIVKYNRFNHYRTKKHINFINIK